MGDAISPFTISPPPPPSSSSRKGNMTMLYYGIVVVATAAIVLAIYNLIIIKFCNNRRQTRSQPSGPNGLALEGVTRSRSFDNSQRNLLSSFKYKKEVVAKDGELKEQRQIGDENDYDYECPVCLSVYEEGEEVRKLPRCKHSFHALCIDMWLYSHFDCPVCRTPVGPFCHPFPAGNSSDGLMESGGISV